MASSSSSSSSSLVKRLWKKSRSFLLLSRNNNKNYQTKIAAGFCSSSSSSTYTEDEQKAMFEEWAVKYGKTYDTPEEKEWRFVLFKMRLKTMGPDLLGPRSDISPGGSLRRAYVPPPPNARRRRPGEPHVSRIIEPEVSDIEDW